MICKQLFIAILCMGILACASTKNVPQKKISQGEFEQIKLNLVPLIEHELQSKKIVGLSVAMVVDGQLYWQQGFGFADKKNKTPVTATTDFRVGSLSKIINALAIIRFVEQGKIDLDKPVQDYLPELDLNISNKPITLRHLLSHQSGLPSDLIRGMWTNNPESFSKVRDYLNQHGAIYPPDKMYLYSNLGFNLIGMVIEEASGEDYESYMNRFLDELGMDSSHFSSFPKSTNISLAYKKGKAKQELGLRDVPAAGLTSNAGELANIISLFAEKGLVEQKRIVQAGSLETLLKDHTSDKAFNLKRRHGLGLHYYDNTLIHRGTRIVGHGGATNHHRAVIKFSPDYKYGLVLLANTDNATASLHKIADKALLQLHRAKLGPKAAQKPVYWPPKNQEDILDTSEIIGHYATKVGLVKVYQQGSKLKAKLAGKTFQLYKRYDNGLYYLKYKLFGLFPIKLGHMGNIGLSLHEIDGKKILVSRNTLGNREILGKRIQPSPISSSWKKHTGRYKIATPLEVMDFPSGGIKVIDGFLVAHAKTEHGNKMQFVLRPINDTEAIVEGIGRGLAEKVISEDEALWYSGIRFIKE